jgi:hypothetical protein
VTLDLQVNANTTAAVGLIWQGTARRSPADYRVEQATRRDRPFTPIATVPENADPTVTTLRDQTTNPY